MLFQSAAAARATCSSSAGSASRDLAVSRTVVIDASEGNLYGSISSQPHQPTFLKPKEVVLTFDDGPMPWVTKSILDTLDSFCTKATFFAVGRMALNYPKTVQDIQGRGHTLASHTYSHPYNLSRLSAEAAEHQIERGIAAVATAAGQPIAPFFRFPGLADNKRLLTYLKTRNIATFTVDVVTNDSYINDPKQLVAKTLAEVEKNRGGIVLFHDIKVSTAKALPDILAGLQARGYSVVHITAKAPAEPILATLNAPEPTTAKVATSTGDGRRINVPFYGTILPETTPAQKSLASAKKPGLDPSGARIYGWATTVGRKSDENAKSSLNPAGDPRQKSSQDAWTPRTKTPYVRKVQPTSDP